MTDSDMTGPSSPSLYRRIRAFARRRKVQLQELAWRITDEGRKNQASLEELRGRYSGRRCFVIGNGPSINQTDIRRLRNELTIGSNALFLLFEQMGFKPTFLTVEDNLVAEDRAAWLNAIRGTTKIFPRDLSYCLRLDEDTVYVNFERHYLDFPKFSDDFARIVYFGGTVTMLNLQLAYYLGCNPIYLVGVDHSYKVPPKLNSVVITSEADDENHFDPTYFGKGFRWHDPKVERMEQSYREARRFLSAHNVSVYNATVGGQLEVFDRVDFGEVTDPV